MSNSTIERTATDVRAGLSAAQRSLARHPAVTLTVLIILGLGIGASTAMFSVMRGVLAHSIPYPRDGELAEITSVLPKQGSSPALVAFPRFEQYAAQAHSVTGFAAYGKEDFSITDDPAPVSVEGARVSPDFFRTLEVVPVKGRDFSPAEQLRDGARAAIIDERLWQGKFGGAPDILQKTISINGEALPIVGVVPARFAPPLQDAEVFLPRVYESNFLPPEQIDKGAGYLRVIVRLKPGVTAASAKQEMQQISGGYKQQFAALRDAAYDADVVPLSDYLFGTVRDSLIFLWLAGTLVFLIACANAGNVLLARYLNRHTELDMRSAMGATRRQLLLHLLAECTLLAAGGVVIGVITALGLRAWLTPMASHILLTNRPFAFDPALFLLAALLGTLAVLMAGAIPAMHATADYRRARLAPGARGATAGRGALRLRYAFIVAQIAVSFALLAGALQQVNTLSAIQRRDRGFDPHGLLAFQIAPSAIKYPTPDSRLDLYARIEERLAQAPGVSAVSASQAMPVGDDQTIPFIPELQHAVKPEEWPHAQFRIVSAGYSRALGLTVQRGRAFAAADTKDASPVVMINETLAHKFFRDTNPVGTNIFLGSNPVPRQIVGVVSDVREQWLNPDASPAVYLPSTQLWVRMPPVYFVARSSLAPAALLSAVRSQVAAVDPAQAITHVQTMTAAANDGLAIPKMREILVVAFALLGTLLAAVGLWSTMSQLVAERTREIGIRMALGAPPMSASLLVIRTGLALSAAGVALGVLIALSLGRITQHVLEGIERPSIAALAGAGILFVAVGVTSTLLPARRAARTNPLDALRAQSAE